MMTKSSAEIVIGGNFDEQKRRIAPTVYRDVKEDDSLLEGYDSIPRMHGFGFDH